MMAEEGDLFASNGSYRWVADEYPAESVSLRASGDDPVVIQERSEGRPIVIGEVDRSTAPILIHEGAVYIHEGRTYLVERFDEAKALASVVPAEVDYYTDASESVELEVLEVHDADESLPARRAHGWAEITSTTTSFRKVKRYTHETIGYGQIDLPPRTFETSAYWLWIDAATVETLEAEGVLMAPIDYGPSWAGAKRGALARDGRRCRQCGARQREGRSHDVHHLKPFRDFGYVPGENDHDRIANDLDNLITLCPSCHQRAESARGARSAVQMRAKGTRAPTITLYDRTPDGLGLAPRLYELHSELLQGALDLVRECACIDGCPACVGPVGPGGGQVKALTAQLLHALVRDPSSSQDTPR
jgi:DEAD/DEAH box helicase domain-containing protein